MTDTIRPRSDRGGVRVRAAAAGAVAVAIVGLLARATLADTSSGSSYRTAAVTRATVLQTLSRSGTIEPVAQATIAFPVAGTVATVAAKVGDPVSTGQALASLDTTSLSGDLATKQAALAAAQLTLDQAVAGQTASATRAQSSASPSVDASGGTGGGARASVAGSMSPELASSQQQVLGGQKAVDADMAAAEAALDDAAAACTVVSPGSVTSTTVPAAKSAASPPPPAAASVPAGSEPAGPAPAGPATSSLGGAACISAQQRLLASQQNLAGSLRSLAQVESSLDDVLTRAAGSAASTTSSESPSGNATSPSGTGSASSQQPASQQPASQPAAPTAAQLVADQSAVDAADAAVRVAQQSVDQATVVSPIAGTVAAVNLLPGQQVSSGSTTADVVVVGAGGFEVATSVGVDDVDKVKTGQTATIVPDGTSTPLDARVVSVGVAGTTIGAVTTYPVVVGFTGSPTGLGNGASASVAIDLARATDALTVPTSAVRALGSLRVVAVPAGGKTRTVPVQVGTVGAERTEVTSGLTAGQVVVLADLNQALPASNTTNAGGGLGGLGGGGLGGGGGARIGGRPPG